jgi:hypothetical protein
MNRLMIVEFDFELVIEVGHSDFLGGGLDVHFFLLAVHRPAQGGLAVESYDFDVLRRRGELFVGRECAANFPRGLDVLLTVALVARCERGIVAVADISAGVIGILARRGIRVGDGRKLRLLCGSPASHHRLGTHCQQRRSAEKADAFSKIHDLTSFR